MRKQTKPFTVEIKPSRKPKTGPQKMSIWGKLDLRADEDLQVRTEPVVEPATAVGGGRS
ncbi:hypothetical protein ABID08_005911 [Rhizobium binae]|uniref:Transposase n=1 Tax=Rhizobium binae TaxID=1138190 RepID=A0ABV2MPZ4_9HYPH|nr:hypothetical protein [Rhizobium binae]MBX4994860.1 hypothetical protein [Rhizobium binae]QSY85383.1 hypothetical protein J2J99_25525 [Rhizobium binae]